MAMDFEAMMAYYTKHVVAINKIRGNGSFEQAIEKHIKLQEELKEQTVETMFNTTVSNDVPFDNSRFIKLDSEAEDLYSLIKQTKTVFLIKPVQAGKTTEVYRILENTYKYSCTIMISTLVAVAGQTSQRGLAKGWKVLDFTEFPTQQHIIDYLEENCGKKRAVQFLMEINNVSALMLILTILKCPVTLIIDEGDKNRSTDGKKDEERVLPPVTRALQVCKNKLAKREDGSKTIYVTATPLGLFCAEKDPDRLVIVKEPFKNWRGVAHNHPCNIDVRNIIKPNGCASKLRWGGSSKDIYSNSYRSAVKYAVQEFEQLESKDTDITQVMLISLETGNTNQELMANYAKGCLQNPENVNIIIFNGLYKDKEYPLLADKIEASLGRKTIVIAGFMASRGISFTDYSDRCNQFELVMQMHAAKNSDPISSSLQAMRIFGPDRKTISKPILICNEVTWKDCKYNFLEMYRIVEDLARGAKEVRRGSYDMERKLVPNECCHYMVMTNGYHILKESADPADHEPIKTVKEVVVHHFDDDDE